MSERVEIAGLGFHMGVEVHGYERPNADQYYDANWLRCSVEVKAGPFCGRTNISVTTDDLHAFRAGLHQALSAGSGSTRLLTLEKSVKLEVSLRITGQVEVSGHLKADALTGIRQVELSFEFESDQSYLKQTLAQLDVVCAVFTIRPNKRG